MQHHRGDVLALQRDVLANRKVWLSRFGIARHDHRAAVGLVPKHLRVLDVHAPGHLLGDRR
jgi:hypothetical protein